MPKRSASTSLTGGTGDVNPQWMVVYVTQSANDTTTSTSFPNPVPKYPGSQGRAIVMEVLAVQIIFDDLALPANNAALVLALATSDLSGQTSQQVFRSPKVLALATKDLIYATGAGFLWTDRMVYVELTDAAGHGVLVGTDAIFPTYASATTGAQNTGTIRIKYRLKEVGLAEYIGIVQSQQ